MKTKNRTKTHKSQILPTPPTPPDSTQSAQLNLIQPVCSLLGYTKNFFSLFYFFSVFFLPLFLSPEMTAFLPCDVPHLLDSEYQSWMELRDVCVCHMDRWSRKLSCVCVCFVAAQANISCPGFQEYHTRLQTFLMWFIETANFIDTDDDHWDFFLVWVLSLFDAAASRIHTHTNTLLPPPVALYCVIEKQKKLPFEAFVTNYPASLIIFPSSENCWSGKNFLCVEEPFQIFQGQELNWMLLSFQTLNNVLTVKRASASVFFTRATINTDNGQNGLKWFGGAQSLLQVLLFL